MLLKLCISSLILLGWVNSVTYSHISINSPSLTDIFKLIHHNLAYIFVKPIIGYTILLYIIYTLIKKKKYEILILFISITGLIHTPFIYKSSYHLDYTFISTYHFGILLIVTVLLNLENFNEKRVLTLIPLHILCFFLFISHSSIEKYINIQTNYSHNNHLSQKGVIYLNIGKITQNITHIKKAQKLLISSYVSNKKDLYTNINLIKLYKFSKQNEIASVFINNIKISNEYKINAIYVYLYVFNKTIHAMSQSMKGKFKKTLMEYNLYNPRFRNIHTMNKKINY